MKGITFVPSPPPIKAVFPLLQEHFNYTPYLNNVSLLMMSHILFSLAHPLIMSPPSNNTVVSWARARGLSNALLHPPQHTHRDCIMSRPHSRLQLWQRIGNIDHGYQDEALDPKSTTHHRALSPHWLQPPLTGWSWVKTQHSVCHYDQELNLHSILTLHRYTSSIPLCFFLICLLQDSAAVLLPARLSVDLSSAGVSRQGLKSPRKSGKMCV